MMLKVSSSPHIRDKESTTSLMRTVFMALMPAQLFAIYNYGISALLISLASVVSAVFWEWLCQKMMHRPVTVGDWSAALTGLLLAFNVPGAFPIWMIFVGTFFAIVVVKQCFGGLGKNFVNPALAARVILMISFPQQMTNFVTKSAHGVNQFFSSVDLVSGATPLAIARSGEGVLPDLLHLVLGLKPGTLGEVSGIALLLGAAYLLFRKVITWTIPVSYIATTLIFTTLCGGDPLVHLFSGGLLLGAFFMATDYVTCPTNTLGQLVFGIGCGLLTGLLRMFGGTPEGVSFSILFMNILTPHIDSLTLPFPRKAKKEVRS